VAFGPPVPFRERRFGVRLGDLLELTANEHPYRPVRQYWSPGLTLTLARDFLHADALPGASSTSRRRARDRVRELRLRLIGWTATTTKRGRNARAFQGGVVPPTVAVSSFHLPLLEGTLVTLPDVSRDGDVRFRQGPVFACADWRESPPRHELGGV
jgi:hypothetical protein